jgi:hypothetical protein
MSARADAGVGIRGGGEIRMVTRSERGEVVFTATSCEGITYEIIRQVDGAYAIVADGRPVKALFWRAGELDRCAQFAEQLAGTSHGTNLAAA